MLTVLLKAADIEAYLSEESSFDRYFLVFGLRL